MAATAPMYSPFKGEEGDTAILPIGGRQGIRGWALVDREDFGRLSRRRWCFTTNGYVRSGNGAQYLSLHRGVLRLGRGDSRQVDHLNGSRTDCRKANLRVVTRSQNYQNQRGRGGSSQYRGVYLDKRCNRWVAQHTLDYRPYVIGRFDTEREAHEAAVAWRKINMPWSDEHGEAHEPRVAVRKVAPAAPKQEDVPEPELNDGCALPMRNQYGTVTAWAIVDADDFEWATKIRWHSLNGYVQGRPNGFDKTFLHREVMGLKPGDGQYVDHVNRDRADCRKSNLRVCSTAQVNCQNVPGRGGTSAHRGVSWHKASRRWRVRVGPHYVGSFETEQ